MAAGYRAKNGKSGPRRARLPMFRTGLFVIVTLVVPPAVARPPSPTFVEMPGNSSSIDRDSARELEAVVRDVEPEVRRDGVGRDVDTDVVVRERRSRHVR